MPLRPLSNTRAGSLSPDTTASKERFVRLKPFLNERQRRLAAAAEAQSLGRGGISAVADATGVGGNVWASRATLALSGC